MGNYILSKQPRGSSFGSVRFNLPVMKLWPCNNFNKLYEPQQIVKHDFYIIEFSTARSADKKRPQGSAMIDRVKIPVHLHNSSPPRPSETLLQRPYLPRRSPVTNSLRPCGERLTSQPSGGSTLRTAPESRAPSEPAAALTRRGRRWTGARTPPGNDQLRGSGVRGWPGRAVTCRYVREASVWWTV